MWNVRKLPPQKEEAAVPAPEIRRAPTARTPETSAVDRMIALKVKIHRMLLDRINLSALDKMSREQISGEIAELIGDLLAAEGEVLNRAERTALCEEVLDELLGLGPLEPLLKDETITDILVNGCEAVFVERRGLLERAPTRFQDERHLLRIIQKIVTAVGRRVDESSPFVDARLADGSPRQRDHLAARDRRLAAVDPQVFQEADQHGSAGRARQRSGGDGGSAARRSSRRGSTS